MANPAAQMESMSVPVDRRNLLKDGDLQRLIDEDGLRGMTSNPSIFEKAIADSTSIRSSLTPSPAAPTLMPRDVTSSLPFATSRMPPIFSRPVFKSTNRRDGYVSLEVSPYLANDTEGTLEEARRLWASVARDNIMIKVPGTPEGIPAFRQLIGEGINVNVTLSSRKMSTKKSRQPTSMVSSASPQAVVTSARSPALPASSSAASTP